MLSLFFFGVFFCFLFFWSVHSEVILDKERELELENLILKDSSVRRIWTYLIASPCYTTNTNKHGYTTKNIVSMNKQLLNAVSQSSYKCAETSELNFFHGHREREGKLYLLKQSDISETQTHFPVQQYRF